MRYVMPGLTRSLAGAAAIAAGLMIFSGPALADVSRVLPEPEVVDKGGVLPAGEDEFYTAEATRERLYELLEELEWFATSVEGMPSGLLDEVHRARLAIDEVPYDKMDEFAQLAGNDIDTVAGTLTVHRLQLLAAHEEAQVGESGEWAPPAMQMMNSGGFPPARFAPGTSSANMPQYSTWGVSDENTGGQADCCPYKKTIGSGTNVSKCRNRGFPDGPLCDRDEKGSVNRTDRVSACTANIGPDNRVGRNSIDAFKRDRLRKVMSVDIITAILESVCGGTSIFSCEVCCLPIRVTQVITTALYDLVVLCDDTKTAAEVEGALHVSANNYNAIAHVHGDIETLSSDVFDWTARNLAKITENQAVLGAEINENEARLDDESRFTDDSEIAAHEANLIAQINENEARLDDESRFADDTELAAHEANLIAQINENEARLDDEFRFTDDDELAAHDVNITGEIDGNEIKIDVLQREVEELRKQLELATQIPIQQALLSCGCTPGIFLPEASGGRFETASGLVEEWLTTVSTLGDPDLAGNLAEARRCADLAAQAEGQGRYNLACKALATSLQLLSEPSNVGKGSKSWNPNAADRLCLRSCNLR